MDRNVAIVGCSQSDHQEDMQKTREEMVFDAAKGALDDAGFDREELDTVINASNDYLDGYTISNVHLTLPEGAYMTDESKVEQDGAFAALYTLMRILSGTHDIGLVVGNTQGSVFDPHLASSFRIDQTFDRQIGLLNDISSAALQAKLYMKQANVEEEQIANVSVKNLENALDNPKAHRKVENPTLEKVLDSELFYDPIRELMTYPVSDGACALVLASENRANEITDDPVWISGVGSCQDSYIRDRDLTEISSLKKASRKAYERADIEDPKELDILEISEKFAHQELMIYEALGICDEGEGGDLIEKGYTEQEGEIPVNPSGGALSANPECATGLIRMAETVNQIKGKADGHQIPDVGKGLAHGQIGLCAQSNVVFILSGELE